MRKIVFIWLLCFIVALAACAPKKKPEMPPPPPPAAAPADLREFPQNLEVFAKQIGVNKRLLSEADQAAYAATFNRVFYGPWDMSRTSIRAGEISSPLKKARGYKANSAPWTQAEWDAMRANANLKTFPSRTAHAITLRATDLREVPTHEPRYSKPTPNPRDNPFDYFQYSLLPVGTPVLVAHATNDGAWYYVECPVAGGWVDAKDVAFVDENFKSAWRNAEQGALIRDKVNLGPSAGLASIGAALPMEKAGTRGTRVLYVPEKNAGGMAQAVKVNVSDKDAAPRPMPLTAGNVAKIGDEMMGQPYGWGGMLGERDCSALVRELFTPFGVWLPRNSAAQARRGSIIPLEGMSAKEKERLIMNAGVPFFSLVGMRGHITLYVGVWKGRAAIFHNVWGVRVIKNGDDNERLVIGKAVVTSVTPAIEVENLYRPVTFVDRLRSLTHLGRP